GPRPVAARPVLPGVRQRHRQRTLVRQLHPEPQRLRHLQRRPENEHLLMAKLPANATRAIVAVVVAAIVAVGVYFAFLSGGSQKKVTAQFASAVGVYKGTPVKIL